MFEEALAKIRRKISLSILRGVLTGIKDDKTSILQIQALAKEVISDVEFFQPYGFASHPHPGAEIISLAVGGNKDHSIVICANDKRYKIPLLLGESAIFTSWGDKIVLKQGNVTEITTKKLIINALDEIQMNTKELKVNATTKAQFTTPIVEASQDILATQKIVATVSMAAGAYVPMAGAAAISMSGDVESSGEISDSVGSMSDIRATYNGHKHLDGSPKTDVPDSLM